MSSRSCYEREVYIQCILNLQVKLGRAAVRRLVVRNPGERGLEVLLDKMPKPEKGFNVDYAAFRLGGREETELLVGWTPQTSGGVRDSYIVR